jgi:hypothetical protein
MSQHMQWQYTRPTSNLVLGNPHLQERHHHTNKDMGPVLVHIAMIAVVYFATVRFINNQNKGTVQTAMKHGVLKRYRARGFDCETPIAETMHSGAAPKQPPGAPICISD